MSELLAGKKVAFLVATEGVEQVELTDPWEAVVAENARPSIVSTESGTIQAFNHLDKADVFDVGAVVESASSSEYDALVLPGGVANPDFLRMNPEEVAYQRISEASDRLSETTALFTAWSGRFHELTWLSARGSAQSAWSCLVTTLCTASGHLKEPSWWNPVVALNNLLDVYIASRSVHAHVAGQPDALGRLVSPTIEAAFLRTEGLRHQLEQALTTDSAFKSNSDAHKLYVAVQEHIPKSKAAEAVPGKELADRPALAALFRDGTTSLRDNLDPALLDKLDERAQEIMKGYIPTGNARFDSHLELLLGELSTSPAWTPPDSHYFTSLVAQVLRFLYDRFDAQANLYGARTAYLGPAQPTKDGKPGSWHEKALQDDLHQHLSGTLTPGTVKREISDVAGGRTDITYTPGLGAISWPKLRGGRGSAREKRWKVATCHKR